MFQHILVLSIVSLLLPAVHARGFDDVDENDRYADAIEFVANEDIVDGYSDGSYRSYAVINRAEFLKIVMEATNAGDGGSYCFRDVAQQWYAQYVCHAQRIGMIRGYPDGTFRPSAPINYGEAAVLLLSAYGKHVKANGNVWYADALNQLEDMGADPPTIHSFSEQLTRGEMAYIIWKVEDGEANSHHHGNDDSTTVSDFEPFLDYSDDEIEQLEDIDDLPDDSVERDDLMAWDNVLMGIVKRRFVAPPVNARAYAALAIAQRDVLVLGEEVGASSREAINDVSRSVMCYYFPLDCSDLAIDSDHNEYATAVSVLVSRKLIERLSHDPTDRVLTPPVGPGYWSGSNPVGSFVYDWRYLVVDEEDGLVPSPPVYGSDDDFDEIQQVKDSLRNLSAKQLADTFIWDYPENVSLLFSTVAHEYLNDEDADLQRAADVRMALYTAISDGFTAAWKAKYTYWTARPSQRDYAIDPVLIVPSFPSYPSGHSTLSGAAYGVLKRFYPREKDELHDMAVTNRDAREWSGVHFRIDDIEGMKLGERIADTVMDWYEDQD